MLSLRITGMSIVTLDLGLRIGQWADRAMDPFFTLERVLIFCLPFMVVALIAIEIYSRWKKHKPVRWLEAFAIALLIATVLLAIRQSELNEARRKAREAEQHLQQIQEEAKAQQEEPAP